MLRNDKISRLVWGLHAAETFKVYAMPQSKSRPPACISAHLDQASNDTIVIEPRRSALHTEEVQSSVFEAEDMPPQTSS